MEDIKETDRIIVDLELLQIDYNEEKKNSLKHEISKKYNVPLKNIEINFKPILVGKDGKQITLVDKVKENIQNASYQKDLMRTYIKTKGYNDIKWDDVDKIDNQVNMFINFDQYSNYRKYKFKYAKWSNYLSYGEDNYFDFTKLHGLVLLNSEPSNQGGKTTFAIDLLRFGLFGKADKSPNLDSVFNTFKPEATTVLVEIGLEIDNTDYVIRRTITRPPLEKRTAKSKCKQRLEYFRKVGEDLEIIENCEGESVQQTNNIIQATVGNVEDFNLVISATSYSLGDLLRMGQTDKGKVFSRWLGLISIEKKEEIAKKIWKENYSTKLLSNTYNKENILEDIKNSENNITTTNDYINVATKNLNTANENLLKYCNQKNDILAQLKPITNDLDKIDVTTLNHQTEQLIKELEHKKNEYNVLNNDFISLKDIDFDEKQVSEVQQKKRNIEAEINEIKIKNAEIKTEINHIRTDTNRINELIKQGICPTCNQPIDVEEKNNSIAQNKTNVDRLIKIGVGNKEKIDALIEELKLCEGDLSLLEDKKQKYIEKNRIELKMGAIKINMENIELKIENNKKIQESIKINEANIKYNSEIRAKALVIDESIKQETIIKENKIREIEGYKNSIAIEEKNVLRCKEIYDKLVEEEKVIRNWNIYQELIGKSGIIKMVLKESLPIINCEIARILNGICDFECVLSVDSKNNVVIKLVKDGKAMDMGTAASGFENTICSLALRSALASISSISKPNFLTTDEIMGLVAANNYDNIHELYKRIIMNYDFIINITHNENIYDWHDGGIITVVKENNISKILFK